MSCVPGRNLFAGPGPESALKDGEYGPMSFGLPHSPCLKVGLSGPGQPLPGSEDPNPVSWRFLDACHRTPCSLFFLGPLNAGPEIFPFRVWLKIFQILRRSESFRFPRCHLGNPFAEATFAETPKIPINMSKQVWLVDSDC